MPPLKPILLPSSCNHLFTVNISTKEIQKFETFKGVLFREHERRFNYHFEAKNAKEAIEQAFKRLSPHLISGIMNLEVTTGWNAPKSIQPQGVSLCQ